MDNSTLAFPVCGGNLERGFLLDHMHGGGTALEWVQGPPEPSFWVGVKTSGKDRVTVVSKRCTKCGYLMLFAPAEE